MFLGQRFLTVLNKTGMASVSLRLFRPYPQHLQLHIPNLIITRLSQKRGAFLELRTTAKRVAVDGGMLLVLTSRRKKRVGNHCGLEQQITLCRMWVHHLQLHRLFPFFFSARYY